MVNLMAKHQQHYGHFWIMVMYIAIPLMVGQVKMVHLTKDAKIEPNQTTAPRNGKSLRPSSRFFLIFTPVSIKSNKNCHDQIRLIYISVYIITGWWLQTRTEKYYLLVKLCLPSQLKVGK